MTNVTSWLCKRTKLFKLFQLISFQAYLNEAADIQPSLSSTQFNSHSDYIYSIYFIVLRSMYLKLYVKQHGIYICNYLTCQLLLYVSNKVAQHILATLKSITKLPNVRITPCYFSYGFMHILNRIEWTVKSVCI